MTRALYDDIAEWYDESIRKGSLLHDLVVPPLLALAGDVRGRRVCDLACGQGVVARQLAGLGASVVGVDLSARLLEIARRDEEAELLGITYLHDDAQTLATVADAAFDGVVCNMALMDIPDLEATFQATRRVLRPEGWFIFSITHPCYQTPSSSCIVPEGGPPTCVVSGYFAEGYWRSTHAAGVRGQVGAYHRTLGTYVNSLLAAGLTFEHLVEPRAVGPLAERRPGLRELPAALIARCRKHDLS